jgi:hypothetical protein
MAHYASVTGFEITHGDQQAKPMIYRRAIRLVNSGNRAEAEMEDDFHHFRVWLRHEQSRIVASGAEGIRFPWTTCGSEAAGVVNRLKGFKLESLATQLSTKQRYEYCTHMFDLAELAVVHASRDEELRRYDIAVEVVPERGAVRAELSCAQNTSMTWELCNQVILAPDPFTNIPINELKQWVQENLDVEAAEAALILRRAVHVSFGKIYDWSYAKNAAQMNLPPTCYTFSPSRAGRALAIQDHARDFTEKPEEMMTKR